MTKAAELAKMGEVLTNSQIGGRRNIIINGAMQVAQRSTSETGLGASSTYSSLDRFKAVLSSTAGRFTMSKDTDTPDEFGSCMKLDCTTADTSIAAAEVLLIQQPIEGQNVQQFKKGTSDAEKITVSFYMKTSKAFTFLCELDDTDNNRFNSQQFTTSTSWTRHVLTFNGDTTGTMNNDEARSFQFGLFLHAGANFTGGTYSANTWQSRQSTNVNRAVGCDSFFDSTDNIVRITGVQLEVGSQATPFEHRSFGEELMLCKRYCNVIAPINDEAFTFGHARTSTTAVGTIRLHPVMRGTPTLAFSGVTEFQIQHANSATQTSGMAAGELSTEGVTLNATVGSGLTTGQGIEIREQTTGATVTIDAEL